MNLTPEEKDLPVRPFGELRDSGLLWLINRVVFHPRGFALALVMRDGDPVGWKLLGDGTEVWRFEGDEDEEYQRVEATMRAAGLPASTGDPAPPAGDEIDSEAVMVGYPNRVVAYRYVAPDGHVMVLDPADVAIVLADGPNQP
jgi:hypothetical protein